MTPTPVKTLTQFRVAEFFAGIGLVRLALEQEGFRVVFANDIEPLKRQLYAANFDASHFVLGDVRGVRGADIPDIEVATASFPCTDLSLAGNRAGLAGPSSGMFWEFTRVLEEMGSRRPATVLLENVVGLATSREGKDLYAIIERLNKLGYRCDALVVDARWFVPQSRPRLFIVGTTATLAEAEAWEPSDVRPAWVRRFAEQYPDLDMHALPIPSAPRSRKTLAGCVERLPEDDARWWDSDRLAAFTESLSPLQAARVNVLKHADAATWAAAYRRTRHGKAVWEVRADALSGCLRTATGGSSRQAVVRLGHGSVRARWMTAREYARLQGAPDFALDDVRDHAALLGFGDAVCVPVVSWIARVYLRPLLAVVAESSHSIVQIQPLPPRTPPALRASSVPLAPPARVLLRPARAARDRGRSTLSSDDANSSVKSSFRL